MRKLPSLNAIRAFEAAARHVSFTKAADELHVTHGAVSRQVASLEEWLSTPLFNRSRSLLTLTDAGASYLAEVTPALDRLSVASMNMLQRAVPTSLAINAPPTFTMRWLIARISGFQRLRPDVEARLTTSLAPVNFAEHRYDVAIRGAHEPLAGCVSRAFMTEIILPVCHIDLLQGRPSLDLGDLPKHPLIGYATEPYAWSEWFKAVGVDCVHHPGALRFEQMYFALQAAAEGLGIVLVPLFLALDEIVAGRLCAPFGPLGARSRHYYANCTAKAALHSNVADFVEWLVKEGRQTEASTEAWAESMGWEMTASAAPA